jgi:hypothetical protein
MIRSEEVLAFSVYERLWLRCPYCLTSDLHRIDQLTSQEYHSDKTAVASERVEAWKQRRGELLAELLNGIVKDDRASKVKSKE